MGLKEIVKKTFLRNIWDYYLDLKNKYEAKYVIPPYSEKRKILLGYKNKFDLEVFVETGTFLGDTVNTFKFDFKRLISFELSPELAEKAVNRFRNEKLITIVCGDSGKLLPQYLTDISGPCLFWLDGHYSSEFFIGDEFIKTAKGDKNTPILEELKAILTHQIKGHVILIDDARCFNGKSDYPKFSDLKQFVNNLDPNLTVTRKRDIIRILPSK